MTIYAAYGSNLNHAQMAMRCPNAKFIGTGKIKNYRLVFRGVADIEWEKDSEVLVGLWDVTPECMDALDRYEGYPRMYDRLKIKVFTNRCKITQAGVKVVTAFIYFMKCQGYQPPMNTYYKSIEQGYKDCGLPVSHLEMQLTRAERLYTYQMINESELLANGIF